MVERDIPWGDVERVVAAALFALGFYVALLVVVLVCGEANFNAAFPNPWRLGIGLPATVVVILYSRIVLRR